MSELSFPPLLYLSLALVAALYSSVGHGGASGYLAVLALFGIASPMLIPVVLLMNILVASISFFNYSRAGHFDVRILVPFIITSIPAAYVGGYVSVSTHLFGLVLGLALILAGIRLLVLGRLPITFVPLSARQRWAVALPVGVVLGFVSGMIGIGGGIFLSPILLLLGWADLKKTAAVSSAFIVLNSLSGLWGHIGKQDIPYDIAATFLAVVLVGALIGSYVGAAKLSTSRLQVVLALVLFMAGIKMLMTM